MQKSMMNWICLFFFGTIKPCAAHSELFVLQSTPISHSLRLLSLVGEGVNMGLDMICHDTSSSQEKEEEHAEHCCEQDYTFN
jgi:hypothetical protein